MKNINKNISLLIIFILITIPVVGINISANDTDSKKDIGTHPTLQLGVEYIWEENRPYKICIFYNYNFHNPYSHINIKIQYPDSSENWNYYPDDQAGRFHFWRSSPIGSVKIKVSLIYLGEIIEQVNRQITVRRPFGHYIEPNPNGWGDIEVLSDGEFADNFISSMTVDNSGNIHFVMNENNNIYYKSKPLGGTWSEKELITKECYASYHPSIFADNFGNIHVAWFESSNYSNSGWDDDVCYKMKPYNGNWTIAEIVSTESTDNAFFEHGPAICVDGFGIIHIAWADDSELCGSGEDLDIYHKSKTIVEQWVNNSVSLISTESSDTSWNPSITVDMHDTVHVVWADEEDYENCGEDRDIFYKFKLNNSSIWSKAQVVSTDSFTSIYGWGSDHPSIIVDDQNVIHVIWDDDSPNLVGSGFDSDIFYKSKSFSEKWENCPIEVVSDGVYRENMYSSFDIDENGRVLVTYGEFWYDGNYRAEIYYTYKSNNTNWDESPNIQISPSGRKQGWYPVIKSTPDDKAHIIWRDYTQYNGCGNDADIFYRESLNLKSPN